MFRRKEKSEKGRPRLSKVFQKFEPGDKVALVRDFGVKSKFPKRFHGRTGIIEGRMGKALVVKFLNGKSYKKIVVRPVHLKKLKG